MVSRRTYHPEKHFVTGIYTSKGENILQNLTYHYDGFSNLDARIDNQRNLEETFKYDHLNRLTEIWLGTTKTGWMDYDAYGRMTRKVADNHPAFSNAVYDETTKPHAIDRADTYDGVFTEQSVTYTCFDKVKTVTQGSNTVEYAYGYDRQRIFMEEHTGYGDRTKRYVGNCELLTETTTDGTDVRWLTCLVGPMGAFAMVETDERGNNTLHYILKDNLGSWSVVTDKHGNIEQELSFDAWGNLRNPETWRTWSGMPEPMFDRGFTGHEHLYAFGLINMNGRMYDPRMSSFLSVDAYVQSPENAQGFNRYAYCLNNPLRYTDPSGWLPLGPMPGNPFHDNWSRSFVEPVYEPRDLGMEQLTDYDAIWMQGNEVHGGGGDGKPTTQVVTDAGHGIKGKGKKYMDHGACDGSNYESDFALLIEGSLASWLEQFGVSIERTRENEITVDDNPINYRWKLANKAGATVFISIHLDFDAKETAYAVYEPRKADQKWQEDNSIELANYIIQNLTTISPSTVSVIPSTKTNHRTIGVLRQFNGDAGVLLEMGGIASAANRNNIINNHDVIGRQIATGVYQYLHKGSLPSYSIYKCIYY